MTTFAAILAACASMWMQEPVQDNSRMLAQVLSLGETSFSDPERWEGSPLLGAAFLDASAGDLPRSLGADVPAPAEGDPSFSLGPVAGLIFAKDADRGTWFGGVQARLHIAKFFAVEAAITFHQNHYEHGDVIVTQYPLQLTAFLYIIPEGPIRPYILGGVGWYYTRIDYKDSFAIVNKDQTESQFGEHFGAGVELMLGAHSSLNADVRYIFINATNDSVFHGDFNYWQLTLGVNFYF